MEINLRPWKNSNWDILQGEQRICERSWKYKVISQKVDNPALKFLTI